MSIVLTADSYPNNGHLISKVAQLGWINRTDSILDPTFEKGIWWSEWRPKKLTTYNRNEDGSDFRSLPHSDGEFDVCAYDPPFMSPGGRRTSTIVDFNQRYGMGDSPPTPASLQALMNDGLEEMYRLTNRTVLMKCMNYVSSGKMWPGAYLSLEHAFKLGFKLDDILEYVGHPGAQPQGRTKKHASCRGEGCRRCKGTGRVPSKQEHARNNVSVLYVLRKPKTRRRT